MLHDSRVYVDPGNFTPDRFLATEGHVPEMDPSDLGVFGFGRRCVSTRSGLKMKLTESSGSALGNISPNYPFGLVWHLFLLH